MKKGIYPMLLLALAATATVQAGTRPHSHSVVIVQPSELPKSASLRSESMFLLNGENGQAYLYLEQDQGKSLAILNVEDLGNIREAGRVSLANPTPYDFVQPVRDSAALIRFRDGSGLAVISFKKPGQPVLYAEQGSLIPASIQAIGQNTLLVASANAPSTPPEKTKAEILDISDPSRPALLVTIRGLRQRLENVDTGTWFLLGDEGLTVIRRPRLERAFKDAMNWVN